MKKINGENPSLADSLATEARGDFDGIQGLPHRLDRYSVAKKRALQIADYCNVVQDRKMFNKITKCGSYLLFHHYHTVDKLRLCGAQFCKKHLLCPLCAIRRGSKAVSLYLEKFNAVVALYPGLKAFMVTLTTKNAESLELSSMHLRRSLKKLFQLRRNALKGQRHVEFAKALGGFHSIEVTNKGKGWHPHVHMIWLCYESPDPFKLSREWLDITGDSFIVDVRPLSADPADGFIEVCKYALKFSDLSPADNYHAFEVLSGQRLFDSFGCMRGVELPEDLTDEPLDDLPYVEHFFKYLNGSGYSLSNLTGHQFQGHLKKP